MTTVLVVDDDPHIREIVSFALRKDGFETVEAANGVEALERFERNAPALVVLDILMPEMNGTEVCRRLRERASVPIVFLSSKDEELDRILGLELGGDDYITKPFSPRELVARVRAVLRRLEPGAERRTEQAAALQHGRLRLDTETYKVYWDERELTLTMTEFGVLRTLLSRPGKVYSRDALMDGAYELRKIVSDRTMDSHVRRVRNKFKALGADPIETVHGIGYKLGDCA
ncbi:MAG: response regulator [Gammaproteobacteria bacterium]